MTASEPTDAARLRKAFASIEGEDVNPEDAVRVFDALHGQLSIDERRAIVDQLIASPGLAQAWRLAMDLPASPAPKRTSHMPRWAWLSLAAAAALVVTIVPLSLSSRSGADEPIYRGATSRAIASALPPDIPITRGRPVLRWTGVDGGRYRVRVFTPDLTVLDESKELTDEEYTLSGLTIAELPAGSQIFWQVTARIPDGAIVESPTFRSRIE